MLNKELPVALNLVLEAKGSPSRSNQRWKSTVIAVAIATSFGVFSVNAHALALGKLTVQSALGEPLKAEIDLPELSKDEADSLKAKVASPAAFKSAGLEYSPAINGLRVELKRRPDGRAYLQLRSDRAVNDPYLDLILDANSSSGQITRDYTLLFDPPAIRKMVEPSNMASTQSTGNTPSNTKKGSIKSVEPIKPYEVTELAPATASDGNSSGIAGNSNMDAHETASNETFHFDQNEDKPTSRKNSKRSNKKIAEKTNDSQIGADQVTVKPGDVLGQIAATHKPVDVSLDQMLVALLRANPKAFINGNVNQIKAGAVLTIPDANKISAIPTKEARSTVVAHSRDFNAFRNVSAKHVPTSTDTDKGSQSAKGRVTNVESKDNVTPKGPKVKIQPADLGKANEIAKTIEKEEQIKRKQELENNLKNLNTIQNKTETASSGIHTDKPPETPPSITTIETGKILPDSTTTTTNNVAKSDATTGISDQTTVTPPQPTPVVTPTPKPAVSSPSPEEVGFLDEILGEYKWYALGGLGALLIGLIALVLFKRKTEKDTGSDSFFADSHSQLDSFFDHSGGGRVDTKNDSVSASSMYTPSQFDAGDVDPVAEADVYLAYGRDLQAEEILKEALRLNPKRTAIHAKLAEIYAKRHDLPAFSMLATEVHKLSQGQGIDWEKIQGLGRGLDPNNSLYGTASPNVTESVSSASSSASSAPVTPIFKTPLADSGNASLNSTASAPLSSVKASFDSASSGKIDTSHSTDKNQHMDLDLAFSSPTDFASDPISSASATSFEMPSQLNGNQSMSKANLETKRVSLASSTSEPQASGSTASAPLTSSSALTTPTPLEAAQESGVIEFDLDSRFSASSFDPVKFSESTSGDPLDTKLALAEEFNAMGNIEEARALVQEVISEAMNEGLKTKAQNMLKQMK